MRAIQLTASGLIPPARRIQRNPTEYFQAGDVLAREPSAIRRCRDVIFQNQRLQSAISVDDRDLFIVESAAENVGRCVDVRVHEAGDRAYGRWRWRKHPDLREQLAGIDNCRHAGRADDRNSGFQERAPAWMSAQGLVAVGAADVNRTGGLRPAAAVSEFPPREIGPAHGSDSCIANRHQRRKIVGHFSSATRY
jgi:hypothetical protein